MPISKKEFENGKLHSKVESEILSFLGERKKRAFTSQEIMEGIRYHTEFSTPEITKMSTFAISDFTAFLHHLVKIEKIKMKIVRGRMFFMTGRNGLAKCPKCKIEVAEPKKTWKMAGRPNKKDERLQLHIGLFECPKHGTFRTVLGKLRISARAITDSRKKEKKKTIKKQAKRKSAKKHAEKQKTMRKKKKESSAWLLV